MFGAVDRRVHDQLSAAIEARNRAQDNYDFVVYVTLFEHHAQDAAVQLSLGVTAEDTPVPVEFLAHDVPPGRRWGEGHGLR